jgi:hypothetical protein
MARSMIAKVRNAEAERHAENLREGISIYYIWVNIYVSDIGNLDTSSCFARYSDAVNQARTLKKDGFSYVYTVLLYPYGNKSLQATRIYNLLKEDDFADGYRYEKEAEMMFDLSKMEKYPS